VERHLQRPPGAPLSGTSELGIKQEVSSLLFDGRLGALMRSISFKDVCEYLGLDNGANEDPGMWLVLDGLVSDHKSLQALKGSVSVDEYHSMAASLDWKACQAMTIRLGDLRIIHQHATIPGLDGAERTPTASVQDHEIPISGAGSFGELLNDIEIGFMY